MRPAELATDETPMLPVLQHAAEAQSAAGFTADVIVLLQPTSPLRRAEHIDAAVDLLAESGADSVVSVVEVPHQFNPVSVMTLQEGKLHSFLPGRFVTRRQDKPQVLVRVTGRRCWRFAPRYSSVDMLGMYGDVCRPLLMTSEDSVDVDTSTDLELLEWLFATRARDVASRRTT